MAAVMPPGMPACRCITEFPQFLINSKFHQSLMPTALLDNDQPDREEGDSCWASALWVPVLPSFGGVWPSGEVVLSHLSCGLTFQDTNSLAPSRGADRRHDL